MKVNLAWCGGLRRQLILAVALVHMVLMSMFIWDLTRRQQDLLLERQHEQARALAQMLATSTAGWLEARDLAGLQEIIDAQRIYPELAFAMLLGPRGEVLAHSDRTLLGHFVLDLPRQEHDTLLTHDPGLVDVTVPVHVAGHLVGWTRVGIGMQAAKVKLDEITQGGLFYALAAILIGSLLALWLGNRLTAKLYALRRVSEAVRLGQSEARVTDLGRDEVGQLARDFNTMLDTLATMRAELALSEERFRLAASASNTGLWDWDLRDNHVYYSPEWKAQLGYEGDGIGAHFRDWEAHLHPDDREATLKALEECRRQPGLPYNVEFRLRHRDGSWRWINARGEVLRDENGAPTRMLGTHVDVTAQKQTEADKEQLQRQVQHMQKMEALGQLTGGIAHDFNNILSVILGYAQLAQLRNGEHLTAEMRECLDEVRRAGERARDLIAKMLTFARGGSGQPLALDPSPLVREVAKMLASTFPSTIELGVTTESGLPTVLVDPVELHQCLTNLCVNARDATEGRGRIQIGLRMLHGQPEQECSVCHQRFSGDFVELSVADDGPGMPAEVQERIFEPFFTTKDVGKGTGMGLAVVMGIMKKAAGHVSVESRPGCGSTFRLYFPPAKPRTGPDEPAVERPVPDMLGRGRRVLVVDDEPALGQVLAKSLEYVGFAVDLHQDPCKARDAFLADPDRYQALVSDQTMPGMTGLELIQVLRRERPGLPVVLLSGYSDTVDAQRARQMGIRCFLSKPLRILDLVAALRDLLDPT